MNSTQDFITEKNIIEAAKEINGFKASLCNMSGSLEWYNKDLDLTFWATPNWEKDGETPFSLEDGIMLKTLDFNTVEFKGNITLQLKQYFIAAEVVTIKLLTSK